LGELQLEIQRQENNEDNTPMIYKTILVSLTALVIAATSSFAQDSHKSGPFEGAKANTGYVTHTTEGGNSVLTLSDDFKAPDTPDPHWQVVDSNGNPYSAAEVVHQRRQDES
jgi:hypothetical protein